MADQTRVRSLRRNDVPALLAALSGPLAAAYPGGDEFLSENLTGALFGRADAAVAVAETGEVVGLVLAKLKTHGVKLSCLWVAESHRRTGAGTALLSRAVTAFGARPMYVTFDDSHTTSMGALLEAAGFTHESSLPGRYRPGRTEVVYSRAADESPAVRALSLTRPWGSLVVRANKNVENRGRRSNHRGLLVIHGAKSVTELASEFCPIRGLATPPTAGDCPTGYLGVAHLVGVDCHHDECGSWCSPWAMPDSWHWRVAFANAFPEPIPGRGNVSMWEPPAEVLDAVRTLLTR